MSKVMKTYLSGRIAVCNTAKQVELQKAAIKLYLYNESISEIEATRLMIEADNKIEQL